MQNFYSKALLILIFLFSITTYGQQDYLKKIQDYLHRDSFTSKSSSKDFDDLVIYDKYYTESLEVEHVYAVQKINDIPVFNGIGNFAFKNGKIIYFSNSFQSNLKRRTNTAKPTLTATQAVSKAAGQLGLDISSTLEILSGEGTHEYLLSKAGISRTEIPAKLVYQPMQEGALRLAWDISIYTLDRDHWWSVRVDAVTGQIIQKGDWVVHCTFPENLLNASPKSKSEAKMTFGRAPVSFFADGSQYKVFELPKESPSDGDRTIVSEPATRIVSPPYGWHDTDGAVGPEFTITRGNNVWANENRDGDDTTGASPDGGATLDFIFPLDLTKSPAAYTDAAVTNLFYMNNMMHDVWYQYGFDEASGNFQSNNFGNGGEEGDFVIALAQAGADNGPGNNANFATPTDGNSGVMRMFTWGSEVVGTVLRINAPPGLSGSYRGTVAQYSAPIPSSGLTADFTLINDFSGDVHDGCDLIRNPDVSGKIVVLSLGACSTLSRAKIFQDFGAVGIIFVKSSQPLVIPGGEDPSITIPVILVIDDDDESIIANLENGNTVNGTIFEPVNRDGDLSNSIIAHEYGHGISSRLTGGPTQGGCLQNAEQMGEGWSDFFAYMMTMKAGDQGDDATPIGTYVNGEPPSGKGIRQYPYTVNMAVNPFTYDDVQNQFFINTDDEKIVLVHGVGSIWATILWDMTWALIDKYGFDPDLYQGTGGNNIAMQLVIDGLKLQPCSPGFVDGRDAILEADRINNGGANQCLIWRAFANRGVGYSAEQGSSDSIEDQVEAFDMPPASVLDCTVGISDFEKNFFQIYPNPTNGIVNISSAKIKGDVQITLFDINGRKVMSKEVNMSGRATINVSGLSVGVYIMKLASEGRSLTKKLIVQ